MKVCTIVSALLLMFSLMWFSEKPSHADEIRELEQRIKFLKSQKEIGKKLNDMQSDLNVFKNKLNVLQKTLDEFRIQYNLKLSNSNISTKIDTPEKIKTKPSSKKYAFEWSSLVCGADEANLDVIIDIGELKIDVTNQKNDDKWTDSVVLKNGNYSFNMDMVSGSNSLTFSGEGSPDGGTANLHVNDYSCGGDGELVRVNN